MARCSSTVLVACGLGFGLLLPACGGRTGMEELDGNVSAGAGLAGSGNGSAGAGFAGSAGNGPACLYEGKSYGDGSSFPASDGCNTCTCERGQVSCSLLGCASSCMYDGQVYGPGDTFPATDGCSECSCRGDGSILCSRGLCACDGLGLKYDAALDRAKACDPSQPNPCATRIAQTECDYETFVNGQQSEALAELRSIQAQYHQQGCDQFDEPCPPPRVVRSAYCAPEGRCVDVEAAACAVQGVLYDSGSIGIPDPTSCNSCTCDDGKLVCAKMYCPKPCPAGTAFGTQCVQCGPADECEILDQGCLPQCTSTCASGVCRDGLCRESCG